MLLACHFGSVSPHLAVDVVADDVADCVDFADAAEAEVDVDAADFEPR